MLYHAAEVVALCLLATSMSVAQMDSLSLSFFPFRVGDVWNYEYSGPTKITKDSMAAGSHYLFYDNSAIPLYEVDSLLNVIRDPSQESYRSVAYMLSARINQTWVAHKAGTVNFVARLADTSSMILLGRVVSTRRIGYYYQPVGDTSYFSSWAYDDYLASGIGLFLSIGDAVQTPNLALMGCSIDGRIYGSMTSVKQLQDARSRNSNALFGSFPNPFNPLTVVRYRLANRSIAHLRVFNSVGEQIAVLLDGPKDAGLHEITFDGAGLPSGVYFCQLRINDFSQVVKMVLLR